ncbi:lysosomal acid phosphatase-like isoform X2 [Sitodiplosis mosellana]|uniref:lysosomal acid phosphatase-like isoform X2 n=1 Tax=Sitodiplosis mosellana TaxID=263140 RepID=UPI0024440D91|nr:lysosomal acid phosphatase-like isoform X2 [Sitodiplosis mosellana]
MMVTFKPLLTVHLYILYLLKYACSENVTDSDALTVNFAIVIFRHGERSPGALYPKDPHQNFTWRGGFGQLTQRGMQQAYNLGLKSRQRYNQLLPSNDMADEIYVRSSAKKRCLMTARHFLAGFLLADNGLQRSANRSQPIAINIIPKERDKLISQRAPCPKYDKMLKKILMNPPENLKKFIDDNIELFKYISKHTGKKVTSIHSGEQLFDILSIEKAHGLDLPKWTEKIYPEKLLSLAERTMAVVTENDYMKKIKGVNRMTLKSDNQLKPDRKLFIYSGHDTTLINVMRALNITSQTTNKPDFASSLHFEMHHNPNDKDEFEVKIFYRSDSECELKPIDIPKCDRPCSLIAFTKAVKHLIIRDYEQECII